MIQVARLGHDDVSAVREFLGRRIEHSMFLLSNLREAGIEDAEHPRSGVYMGAFAGPELVGVACHYRMGNLIVNAPTHAAALGRAAVEASGRAVAGVVGPSSEVAAIAAALDLPTGEAAQLDAFEDLFRLELDALQIPEPLANGTVRGRELEPADLEPIAAMMLQLRIETTGDLDTPALRESIRVAHEAKLGSGKIWALEHDGQLVARTEFTATLPTAVQIGGVWTPHALRGRGYARCVVASHLLAARASGVSTAILFTRETNIAAQRAYVALGFERVGDYRLLLLRS